MACGGRTDRRAAINELLTLGHPHLDVADNFQHMHLEETAHNALLMGMIRDAPEKIDHALAPALPAAAGVTATHGAYVANGCIGCHRRGLVGGKIAGAPPSWPAAARLAPGADSVMPRYRDVQAFAAMLKSGGGPTAAPSAK